MEKNVSVPILIPFETEEFWAQIRLIIREEVSRNQKEQPVFASIMETPGLIEKPLFKMQEICSLFKVTKPTIYDWIKHGKLKRIKKVEGIFFRQRYQAVDASMSIRSKQRTSTSYFVWKRSNSFYSGKLYLYNVNLSSYIK
jgi:excisionase family DNA binding protein